MYWRTDILFSSWGREEASTQFGICHLTPPATIECSDANRIAAIRIPRAACRRWEMQIGQGVVLLTTVRLLHG